MTRSLLRAAIALAALSLLVGCGSSSTPPAFERVHVAPLAFSVRGEGELRSPAATALIVPGKQWTRRQVTWMLPNGSHVAKGDLVVRFSAAQSRQDLAQAQIDLARNLIARANKQAELQAKRGQLGVDLTQVAGQLVIARRYANAGTEAMARNDILDAIQDAHYLGVRQHILQWRERESALRGNAELAVLNAQRSTYKTVAAQKQADLDALELHAPHAGVLLLEKDWTGQVAHVGSGVFAGNTFATLPNLDKLEVQLEVPQIETQGLQVGDLVQLHPWGVPEQAVTSRLSWVAAAAQPRSKENPVKYLAMKAVVPADVARRFGWTPGTRFVGSIFLLRADKGISVPNVAVVSDGSQARVRLFEDGHVVARTVTLGVRGPNRTQVLAGLREGDRVVIDDGPDANATAGSPAVGAAP